MRELAALLSTVSGFTVFDAGIQVFHAGERGLGPELQHWNTPGTWKDSYRGRADGLFCFAQDLFGRQFAIANNRRVVAFEPETADTRMLGDRLGDWAAWLLADPDDRGAHAFARAWQDRHGPLAHDHRLVPHRLFAFGGGYDDANLAAADAAACMRIRGPLSASIHDLPDGAQVHLMADQPDRDPQRIAYAELDVFADYGSFFVQDDTARPDAARAFVTAVMNDLVAVTDGAIGVGTARRRTLPVILDVRAETPGDDILELDGWDHVTESGLRVSSGRVVVSTFDYRPKIPRTEVPRGDYTARVCAKGFDTITDDRIHGNDLYHVILWPGPIVEPRVLKRYAHLPIPG
ncbi:MULTISPECIES: hypothetical protein [Amycolatopsis]|uniref:hypothetical protein n=1 Tax=Amycolatopsis TaxID=1813 RepID=UPI0007DF1BBE|nr:MULTISPECIES: hypothetical protein [Amycolatopsis]OAP20440.1 hypothetical protein A4R44_08864 [Amycolatopsis sp. M39]